MKCITCLKKKKVKLYQLLIKEEDKTKILNYQEIYKSLNIPYKKVWDTKKIDSRGFTVSNTILRLLAQSN